MGFRANRRLDVHQGAGSGSQRYAPDGFHSINGANPLSDVSDRAAGSRRPCFTFAFHPIGLSGGRDCARVDRLCR